MTKRGRPTDYKDSYAKMARKACEFGAIDTDLAEMFDVSEQTINAWKKKQPEFLEALKGKDHADNLVEQALFSRAVGYSHGEDKVFNNNGVPLVVPTEKHYPPDTAACIIWLGNRRGDKWKKDPSGQPEPNNAPINISIVNPHADSPN